MSCNCRVNKTIEEIENEYGDGVEKRDNINKLLLKIIDILIFIIMTVISPFIFIHILYRGLILNKNYISVKNIVKNFNYGKQ